MELVAGTQESTRLSIPYWEPLLQLFSAMYLPVLFAMLFYLNLVAWASARINYVLIFELDVSLRSSPLSQPCPIQPVHLFRSRR